MSNQTDEKGRKPLRFHEIRKGLRVGVFPRQRDTPVEDEYLPMPGVVTPRAPSATDLKKQIPAMYPSRPATISKSEA